MCIKIFDQQKIMSSNLFSKLIKSIFTNFCLMLLLMSCGDHAKKNHEGERPLNKAIKTALREGQKKSYHQWRQSSDDHISKSIFSDLAMVHEILGTPVRYSYDTPSSDHNRNNANFSECIIGDKPTTDILFGENADKDRMFLANGQEAVANFKFITSKNEINRFFNLHASAGVGSNLGLFSAKANVDYAQSAVFKDEYLYQSFSIDVENPAVTMKNLRLTDDAKKLLAEKGLRAFYDRCGKEAVIGYVTGGSFKGVYSYKGSHGADTNKLRALLEGHGVLKIATLKAKVALSKSEKKNISQFKEEQYLSFKGGLGVDIPLTREEVDGLKKKWTSVVAKNARVLRLIRKPYKDIFGDLVVDASYDTINNNIELLKKKIDQLENLKQIFLSEDTYMGHKVDKIYKDMNQLDDILAQLIIGVQECYQAIDIRGCPVSKYTKAFHKFQPSVAIAHKSCGYHKTMKRQKSPVCGTESICDEFKERVVLSSKKTVLLKTFKTNRMLSLANLNSKQTKELDQIIQAKSSETSSIHRCGSGERAQIDFIDYIKEEGRCWSSPAPIDLRPDLCIGNHEPIAYSPKEQQSPKSDLSRYSLLPKRISSVRSLFFIPLSGGSGLQKPLTSQSPSLSFGQCMFRTPLLTISHCHLDVRGKFRIDCHQRKKAYGCAVKREKLKSCLVTVPDKNKVKTCLVKLHSL
ncbi:MAG: hypothetical protein OXC40_06255 [Proteobacteria bacterium]|nr:hypothetical protein [Pseudomonadota bacterium]